MVQIKEIVSYKSGSGGSERYFQAIHDDKKVLFSIREWADQTPKTIDEVKEAYLTAELPSYVVDYDYSYPLAIFSLTSFKFRNELQPNNMSIWEYEVLIKGNKNVHPALKCAFIQHNDERDLSVICESYDLDSMTTKDNLEKVYSHWRKIRHELMELLGKESDYIEHFAWY